MSNHRSDSAISSPKSASGGSLARLARALSMPAAMPVNRDETIAGSNGAGAGFSGIGRRSTGSICMLSDMPTRQRNCTASSIAPKKRNAPSAKASSAVGVGRAARRAAVAAMPLAPISADRARSGAVWAGAACSGAVCSGAVCSGAVWSGAVWSGAVWASAVWVKAQKASGRK